VRYKLEKHVDGFDDPTNGPKIRFIVPYNRESSFWYKRRYARASRSGKTVFRPFNTELLHIR